MQVTLKNFKQKELFCSCKECTEPPIENITKLALHLQVLRNLLKHPLKVNSAYRCPAYNKKVGGVATSQHVKGLAADISTTNWTSDKKYYFVKTANQLGFNGIGLYDNFIHIDLRSKKAEWDNRQQI